MAAIKEWLERLNVVEVYQESGSKMVSMNAAETVRRRPEP
jgi:hypothetical protein